MRTAVKTTSRRSSRLFLQQFGKEAFTERVGKYEHIHTANDIIIMIVAVEVVHALWDIRKLRPPADAAQSSASNNGKL
uniref:Bm185 n=1 Tax=Brugia malayi TaxID=6279 RepID=A0A1I9GCJ6_BRUMA|nr:Bm185 [Brugia malayi]